MELGTWNSELNFPEIVGFNNILIYKCVALNFNPNSQFPIPNSQFPILINYIK